MINIEWQFNQYSSLSELNWVHLHSDFTELLFSAAIHDYFHSWLIKWLLLWSKKQKTEKRQFQPPWAQSDVEDVLICSTNGQKPKYIKFRMT